MRIPSSLTLLVALALPVSAATITVDSGTDDGVGCTLREAIEAANTDAPVGGCVAGAGFSDEIRFTVASVTLTTGRILINANVDVVGPVTVTAAPRSGIFRMGVPTAVSFSDVSFQGGYGNGGALDIFGNTAVTVTGGAATDNTAPRKGGAFSVLSNNASLHITGTSFTGNRARGDLAIEGGGAIYTYGGAVTVVSATFTDNRAMGTQGSGGAILNPNGAPLVVTNSVFTNNRSQRAGGAIETVGGTTTLHGNTFVGNAAGANPGIGGAVHGTDGVALSVTFGTFRENRGQEGGALWIGGGGSLTIDPGSFIVTFQDNVAEGPGAEQGGGAIYVDGATLSVLEGTGGLSLFSGNRATGASGSGGAILVNGGTVTIDNGTFSENRAQRTGGAIGITTPGGGVFANVDISSSVLSGNTASGESGDGGGIHASGFTTLDLDRVTLTGNDAGRSGGGLWTAVAFSVEIDRSSFVGNIARGRFNVRGGGGLYAQGGTTTVTESTFEGNRVLSGAGLGGGVFARNGTTRLERCLLTGNQAAAGGGVASQLSGVLFVVNSTVHGNTARFGGGGVSGSGTLSFLNATVAENTATISGGGLYNQNSNNGGVREVTLDNTIVAGNTAQTGGDLKGRYESYGWNVIGTTPNAATLAPMATDQLGTDPLLGPLQDNGGPTLTAALMDGSPAIDAGNTDLPVDQRGFARADELDDVGAFEVGATPPGGLVATSPASADASTDAPTLDALAVTPNPFSARATATFAVSQSQPVSVVLYDVMGRAVQRVYAGPAEAETPVTVSVDGGALAAGVYVLVLQGETVRATRQVTVAR